MVDAGARSPRRCGIDSIVGLGGGSSLDCAKGINFLLTNGGEMRDYRGYGKATTPLLPMIGVPTTAGTGSEAQSYAVISDAATHMKMACGDPSAAFRIAILDPELTLTAPRRVTAIAGYRRHRACRRDRRHDAADAALRHVLAPARGGCWPTPSSACCVHPGDVEARAAMQLGAHFAGMAIEQSMLGAAHACANPLTARYDLAHGARARDPAPARRPLERGDRARSATRRCSARRAADARQRDRRRRWPGGWRTSRGAGGLAARLRDGGVDDDALPELARLAAEQWTGTFNPRPFDAAGALEIYRAAF